MNKYDIALCICIVFMVSVIYLLLKIDNNKSKEAIVYYDNKEVLKIDLSDYTYREYKVNGYNGEVLIETVDGKVRVVDEISPKHLCSIQGYISSSLQSIICLPNKVTIRIHDNLDIDTVVN